MAYLAFTDGDGAHVLRGGSGETIPSRLANWIPANYRPQGDAAHVLADEARFVFALRDNFGGSFEVRGIQMGRVEGGMLDIAARLAGHLINGGVVAVYTEDVLAASYLNCGLAPESTPGLVQADPQGLEYTLSLSLINLDGTPMRVHYRA